MTISTITELSEPAPAMSADFGDAANADTTFADEYSDAERYDLEYGQDTSDVPFYLSLAEQADGAVLDVGCGTGRITLALATAGHAVTGVDVDPGLLAQAQGKLGSDDVVWVEQDARELQLRAKFSLVTVAGNSFQHFLSNEDRDAVLKAIYRQLKPGGVFAFAVRFPRASELARTTDLPEVWHTYLDGEGHQVLVSGTSHYDAVAQVMHHQTYRAYATTGVLVAQPTATQLRYHFPQELEAALKSARFQILERFGAFDRTPVTGHSQHLIYVCRKPESTRRSA